MNSYISSFKRKHGRAILILACALCAFFLFDRGISALFRLAENTFYSFGEDRIIPNTPQGGYDTLILGTSRTEEGILPIHLHRHLGLRPLSIAVAGRYPRFNYLAYLRFRKKNGPPRFLFYGVDYFSFAKTSNRIQLAAIGVNMTKINRSEPPPRGLGYLSMLARRKSRTDQLLMDLVNAFSKRLNQTSGSRVVQAGITSYKGLQGAVPLKDRLEPTAWEKADYVPYPGKEGIYLEKLLKQTQRDKVRVFLVYIPDYINVYRTNHLHAEFRRDIRQLADRFSGVSFLDFNRPQRFPLKNPEFFVDGRYGSRISHLSARGARLFNRLLAREVRHHLAPDPGSVHQKDQ